MAKLSIKNTKEAFEILQKYDGDNPYIKMIKNNVLIKKTQTANDFELGYILRNHEFQAVKINKIVKILEWFGDKKQIDWKYAHKISKLQVTYLLGETDNHYHVYCNYKQNQEKPVMCFIPKSALLDNLSNYDYNDKEIDFEKYNVILEKIGREVLPHQKQAVKFLTGEQKKVILADDPGLTKTASTIMGCLEVEAKKILILSPSAMKSSWNEELIMLGEKEEDICIINSTNWITGKKWTIINYDILDNHHIIPMENVNGKMVKSRKKSVIDESLGNSNIYNENFDLLIIDEAHKLANNKSTRSQVVNDFLKRSKTIERVYLLTGTPIANKTKDLFSLLAIIQHPLSMNWEEYMVRYSSAIQIPAKGEKDRLTNIYLARKKKSTWFDLSNEEREDLKDYINKNAKKIWIMKDSANLDELMLKIKDCYLRRTDTDIEGMCKKNIHQIYYDLTEEDFKEYENIWEEYEKAQRELGKEDFNRELNELILLRTFIGQKMCENTIKRTEEFLKAGEKVFILTEFVNEVNFIKERFGDIAVIFTGKQNTKQKDAAKNAFNKDPNIRILIGNIAACGTGINLYEGGHITLFNSFSWAQSANNQALRRQARVGQKHDVEIYFQLFKNTISEQMWETVLKKQLDTDAVIKSEKEKEILKFPKITD